MPAPERGIQAVLDALGFVTDPEADGTAERWVEVLREYAPKGPPPPIAPLHTTTTGPVILRGLPFYSLCVHHLLPFFGSADIGYVPQGRIIGLGAIPKTLRHLARQPQLQERLGEQVAFHLAEALQAPVVVRLRARQMCMEMRGCESVGEVITVATAGPDAEAVLGLLGA